MTYQLKVSKDHPIGFWPMDEISGTQINDISGCGNHGEYIGSILSDSVPLISGGVKSTKVTNTHYATFEISKDYYGSSVGAGLATVNSSDNDFTFEIWMYPSITSSQQVPIFADKESGIGLYWENNNIIFSLEDNVLEYTVPVVSKSFHIVAVYSVNSMSLFVDGALVKSKTLSGFKFTNQSLFLQSGPTFYSDYMLIDAPAVYRYALGAAKIKNHYNEIAPLPSIQIAYPDRGELFEFYDNSTSKQYSYSYPGTKPWTYFVNNNLYYNKLDDSIEIASAIGSKTITLEDIITLPLSIPMTSSKIEWEGDNGIIVEVSTDGINYSQCLNGGVIPGYSISNFSEDRVIYLKIVMSTDDALRFNPKLSSLLLTFYNDHILYSVSSGSYFSTLENYAGASKYDVSIYNKQYPILSRDYRNGIRTFSGSGFLINTQTEVSSVEMFYTPNNLSAGEFIKSDSLSGAASLISWDSSGAITKNNISAIYVNGEDKTSQSNISSVLTTRSLNHIVITYSSPISGAIKFGDGQTGDSEGLFQNIAIYPTSLSIEQVQEHYSLYVEKSSLIASDSSLSVTENGFSLYDNDWLVVKNI